jgi:hypothetical protein
MSIGPTLPEDSFKTSVPARASLAAKKTLSAFYGDPLHYIFYGSLTGIILGLFLKKSFPLELYAILLLLAAVKLYRFYKPSKLQDIATTNEPAKSSK